MGIFDTAKDKINTIKDKITGGPELLSMGFTDQMNVMTGKVNNFAKCKIMVDCANGKKIREILYKQFEDASKTYIETIKCNQLSESLKNGDITKQKEYVHAYTKIVAEAQTKYDEAIAKEIKVDNIDCMVIMKNLYDVDEKTINKDREAESMHPAKIFHLRPNKKTLIVEIRGQKKEGNVLKPHLMKQELDIKDLCIGEAKPGTPNTGCKFGNDNVATPTN